MTVLIAGTQTFPPATGGSPAPRPEVDALRFNLSRSGLTLDLDTPPWKVRMGVEGLDDATPEILEDRAAGLHGGFVLGVDYPSRDVVLPLSIKTRSIDEWRAAREKLRAITNPLLPGMTRLTVTRPDGYSRWIDGYAKILAPAWDADTWSVTGWQRFGLLLRCPSPWWRSQFPPITWDMGSGLFPWFPWPPLRTSASQVLGQDNPVDFGGDAPGFPKWTITGPFTAITVRHVATGRWWKLTDDGTTGGQVTVFTDPQRTTYRVMRANETSAFSLLSAPYDLWEMPSGVSQVRVTVTGATVDTKVTMELDQMWASA